MLPTNNLNGSFTETEIIQTMYNVTCINMQTKLSTIEVTYSNALGNVYEKKLMWVGLQMQTMSAQFAFSEGI